ncbi:sugar kinase [Salinisphaera sp. USBA-960]|nr:sugar kinase [Salifodinibacter halophilus]NNC26409.1 sugar kinase [Salifodinibacter halophilus]
MSRIMTLGEIVVEIMAAECDQRFDAPGHWLGPYPSGAPAIFIDQVARLGTHCSLIGHVGDDGFGQLNVERLAGHGVDTSSIRTLPDYTTGSAFVAYHETGDRQFIYNIANAACAQITPDSIDADALADCTLFHVTGSSLFSPNLRAAMQKAVDLVAANGGQISFDPNIRPEILTDDDIQGALRRILTQTDILMPSTGEITALTDATTEQAAIHECLDYGVKEIVIKRDADGCSFHSPDRTLTAPGLTIDPVDPTGAGDCFAATYVALRQRGFDVEAALTYANAAGANAALAQGPMEGTTNLDQLTRYIEEHANQRATDTT